MKNVLSAMSGGGVKSLNSILSTFHKVVEDLQKLQVANHNLTQLNRQRMAKIKSDTEALEDESARAAKIQDNISKLLV